MQIAQHLEGAGAALFNLLDAEWLVGLQGSAMGWGADVGGMRSVI